MPSILNLKFKGNKTFVAFSNLNDPESLTKTWKVCTKVASYLEQGQRLENLSWRLWHLQNLMVDNDNAKSKREFKKLSKSMGDKLDKEKGRSIEELEAPDFKRNHSTDMIQQRAVEKERNREASQNAKPGTIKRMQFTFSIDQPTPAVSTPVRKPNLKASPEFNKRSRTAARAILDESADSMLVVDDANDKDPPLTQRGRKSFTSNSPPIDQSPSLHFPSFFSDSFGPTALLHPMPSLTTHMSYGEGVGVDSTGSHDGFSVVRPTIELPIDELLNNVDSANSSDSWSSPYSSSNSTSRTSDDPDFQLPKHNVIMQSISRKRPAPSASYGSDDDSSNDSDDEDSDIESTSTTNVPPISQAVKEVLSRTISPSNINAIYNTRAQTPTGRPSLTVRTQAALATRSAPGATATNLNPAVLRHTNNTTGTGNSAPGGVKAECSNCGATHTPLWRRGLNDELNCNACGLYCKLHKRPRPKSMRNTHGEGRTQAAPRQEAVDVMAQCYNCHTTATPLWRKDDEGKTVCNACGLYYKLHGSPRPISMKSDVIRKRSRHDARRIGNSVSETPSVSPDVSRRASPIREVSPTLAPDSTTQMTYDYEDNDYRSSQSELMGALGHDAHQHQMFHSQGSFNLQFPGPYHPDYIMQLFNMPTDVLPFASVDSSDIESIAMSPRNHKRRRMSTDSMSEPPSSAVSYCSYTDGYSTSATSATSHSQRSSMEFPFSSYPSVSYNSGPVFRGSNNTFWHPPMMPLNDNSPHLFHPPMLPPAEDSPMDYLHPPMLPQDEDFFSTYLHPPMTLPDDSNMNGGYPHPPMFPHEYSGHDSYDMNMRVY